MFYLIRISLKCVPKGLIDNRSLFGQIMAGRRSGDKPLSEATMSYITAAYICLSASMS